jgi:hypothetical protein
MTAWTRRAAAARAWIVTALVATVVLGAVSDPPHPREACNTSESSIFLLEAQAVPSATLVPCFFPLHSGWSYGGSDIRSGRARFWLDVDRVGPHAAEVTLTRRCDVSRAGRTPLESPPAGLRRFDEPVPANEHSSISYFVFRGGCVTYRLSFARQDRPGLLREAEQALGFTPRLVYVRGVREDAGLTLCGAEAPPCPG